MVSCLGLEMLDGCVIFSSDPKLKAGTSPMVDIVRCSHIGMVCVPEDAADRPIHRIHCMGRIFQQLRESGRSKRCDAGQDAALYHSIKQWQNQAGSHSDGGEEYWNLPDAASRICKLWKNIGSCKLQRD
ncbi:LOW QUALITY PROTEIN: hypothetical protein RJ640_005675 [Escallonia rubra]|uniref:Uncharacterized protein n=1 Tax=Escallonia rubra TaxID=112253 RepID=A0AA88UT44_9ASTE|nr:LOW QUALITY PROTEIN: hypothetical protein RJ640_005675 [Escallonia rubra]